MHHKPWQEWLWIRWSVVTKRKIWLLHLLPTVLNSSSYNLFQSHVCRVNFRPLWTVNLSSTAMLCCQDLLNWWTHRTEHQKQHPGWYKPMKRAERSPLHSLGTRDFHLPHSKCTVNSYGRAEQRGGIGDKLCGNLTFPWMELADTEEEDLRRGS